MSSEKSSANAECDAGAGAPADGASPRYAVESASGDDGLAVLQDDWNRLSETAELPNVFTTFDWFRAWNQHRSQENHSADIRAEILVLRKDAEVCGIAPLVRRTTRRFGLEIRKLESLASPADYSDLVVGRDSAGQIDAVVSHLAQTTDRWDMVDLRCLRDAGDAKAAMVGALSRAGLHYRILPGDRCSYLPINSSWSGIERRLSRHQRHALRVKQHRLDRMREDGLRVRILENPQDERGLVEKLVALEVHKRVDGKAVPPFIARYSEVFRKLVSTLGPRGWMYVALMELRDQPIAWQLGFRCGGKLWFYQTSYDHGFARLSPGTMLIPAVLDYGFAHGYDEYDFLTGEETYKQTWCSGSHETFHLQVWNNRRTRWAHGAWGVAYRLLGPSDRAEFARADNVPENGGS